MSATEVVATALFAYFVGSIPASYLIARHVVGADVRELGEGNAGARNVFHEVGTGWGIATFLADFGKGALVAAVFADESLGQIFLAGAFVFLGHAFPVWLRFVGGKGLATIGGMSAALIPWAAVIGGAASGVVWTITHRFLPTTVAAVLTAIVVAPVIGYRFSLLGVIIGLFLLTAAKRVIDEPRMKRIEAQTGWNRATGGTGR